MYITYYSKMNLNLNSTEEDFNRQVARHTNRIGYKAIATNNTVINQDKMVRVTNCLALANRIILDETALSLAYRTFKIPKHSGGMRTIEAPTDDLKCVQYDIACMLTDVLHVLPHNAAHGFTKNRNCKTAIQVHQRNESVWFLKLDIKNFFPSISRRMIKEALKNNAVTAAYLTTDTIVRLSKICTKDGVLVQGSPTSPILSNMVLVEFDETLTRYCNNKKLIYTRYADDILISSKNKFNPTALEIEVSSMLEDITDNRLLINKEKTRFGNCNGRNWNLGLMYNKDKEITLGAKKKHALKCELHRFKTHPELQTLENFQKLQGKIGYGVYIEPNYFKPMQDELLPYNVWRRIPSLEL